MEFSSADAQDPAPQSLGHRQARARRSSRAANLVRPPDGEPQARRQRQPGHAILRVRETTGLRVPSAFETIEVAATQRDVVQKVHGALAPTRVNVFEQVERLACQLNEIPAHLKCLVDQLLELWSWIRPAGFPPTQRLHLLASIPRWYEQQVTSPSGVPESLARRSARPNRSSPSQVDSLLVIFIPLRSPGPTMWLRPSRAARPVRRNRS